MTDWFSTHYESFINNDNVSLDKLSYGAALTSFNPEEASSTYFKEIPRYPANFAIGFNYIHGTRGV